jgi:hypothetical protein
MLDHPMPRETILAGRLAEIRAKRPHAEPQLVAEVVRAVLTTMSDTLSGPDTALLREVEALGETIANAKAEIAALKVDDITGSHIPFATDELDAVGNNGRPRRPHYAPPGLLADVASGRELSQRCVSPHDDADSPRGAVLARASRWGRGPRSPRPPEPPLEACCCAAVGVRFLYQHGVGLLRLRP